MQKVDFVIVEEVFGVFGWHAGEVFLQGYLASEGEFVEEVDAVCLLDMMVVVSFMHLKLMCL